MKLIVDCALTSESSDLRNAGTLSQLLAKGKVTQIETPLEALICEQSGLHATPDYPIAAICAAVDAVDVDSAYWLRADPVHLALQRDCFSLGEPFPLRLAREHAEHMLADLNKHFNQDGLIFVIGQSGAWYLRLEQTPQISTTLPNVAAGKNIHQFLPQGLESSKWLAVLNEVQMLLHEHPANIAREAGGELAVNSVWFSGGGVMPPSKIVQITSKAVQGAIVADSIFYKGLAIWAGMPWQIAPGHLTTVLQQESVQQSNLQQSSQHVRLQLPPTNHLDEHWFNPLLSALKNREIKQLSLNLGFYEKSLIVDIQALDLYKFWRTSMWRAPKPIMDYFK